MITFAAQLVQSAMYKGAPKEFPVVAGSVVMLYVRASIVNLVFWSYSSTTQGISTTIVLVRVELGVTYDHHTSNSWLTLHFAPSASNNKQTIVDVQTTINVEGNPKDSHSISEMKLMRNV